MKAIQVRGEVPSDYTGPIYYRAETDFGKPGSHSRFRWLEPEEKMERLLYSGRNSNFRALSSGLIFDADGELLPEWRTPLKGRYIGTGKPDHYEVWFADSAFRVSERVHDAIVGLEPDRHLFLPIDVTTPTGFIRQYLLFVTHNSLLRREIMHRARMGMKRRLYPSGELGWWNKDWLSDRDNRHRFGWLDGAAVDGLHLFAHESVWGNWVISPKLFLEFSNFGHVFATHWVWVPMGVDRSPQQDYDPEVYDPSTPAKPSLLQRILRKG